MRYLMGLLLALAGGPAFAQGCDSSEPWITLEVLASEPAGDEPVELIDVSADGCATVRYASFDTRTGVYRAALSQSELGVLRALIAVENAAGIDADAIRREMDSREKMYRAKLLIDGPELFEVSCGDTYRLLVNEGGQARSIMFYAPKEMARRHPTVRALASLVRVIEKLQETGATTRARARGGRP